MANGLDFKVLLCSTQPNCATGAGHVAQAAAHFGFQVARIDRFGPADERIPRAPRLLIKSLTALTGVIG